MDHNSISDLRQSLAANPDLLKKLVVFFESELKVLDSVSSLDPALPNIGLQALAQRKAVIFLNGIIDTLKSAETVEQKKNRSFS